MEITTRRLLRALNPKKDAAPSLLPFVCGQRFDTTAISVAAAELIEKLCYERFWGCVYFQHDSPDRGAQSGVAVIAGDTIVATMWGSQNEQLTGNAAWSAIRALDFLPECLAIEAEASLVESYAVMLGGQKPASTDAGQTNLTLSIENFVMSKGTGVIRVADEGKQCFEFWHKGWSLGLYQWSEDAPYLQKTEAEWEQLERGRRARLDVWNAVPTPVWSSPLAFSGNETRALCELLGTAHDLAAGMAPPAQARSLWESAVVAHPELNLDSVDMTAPKRAQILENALKEMSLTRAQCVAQISQFTDDFLREWACAIGMKLFATRAALAFSGKQKAALSEVGVELQTVDLITPHDMDDSGESSSKRLVGAIDSMRFKAAPRRNLSRASAFDF